MTGATRTIPLTQTSENGFAADVLARDLRAQPALHVARGGDTVTFPLARVANPDSAPRLANTLNVSFPDLDSETMLMALDLEGICASSGSACMVGSVVASHVLLAMGLPLKLAKSAVRFSLGKFTSAQEINVAVRIILQIIQRTHARHIAQTEHVAI